MSLERADIVLAEWNLITGVVGVNSMRQPYATSSNNISPTSYEYHPLSLLSVCAESLNKFGTQFEELRKSFDFGSINIKKLTVLQNYK